MKTIIVDYEPRHFQSIAPKILSSCPQVAISGYATSEVEAYKLIENVEPSLVIMEVNMPQLNAFQILNNTVSYNFETIIVAHSCEQAIEAIKYQVSGFVLKPLNPYEILPAIRVAQKRILKKSFEKYQTKGQTKKPCAMLPGDLIGIPTIDGFDFLHIPHIIRCEGFQRCTRIITKDRSDIISSYHIGVFSKRLNAFGFYATHKSHLINLVHIEKYLKEGTIKMKDGSYIPISKRRKSEFVKMLMLSR